MLRNIILALLIASISACDLLNINPIEEPGYSIYKTQSDYFDYYNTAVNKKGEVDSYRYIDFNSKVFVSGGDTIFSRRVRLADGYVLSNEISIKDCFTDITFPEYIGLLSSNSNMNEKIQERIIDVEPFVEFYAISIGDAEKYLEQFIDTLPLGEATHEALKKRAKEINEIIANGDLKDHFRRID